MASSMFKLKKERGGQVQTKERERERVTVGNGVKSYLPKEQCYLKITNHCSKKPQTIQKAPSVHVSKQSCIKLFPFSS
jgi:hypothetical protein